MRFEFELNCFLTSEDSRLSDIVFKELELISSQDYAVLRDLLSGTRALWYAEGNRIYLVGDERELKNRLSDSDIDTGAVRLVQYSEMLNRREPVLRALYHSALAQLMAKNDFRPSIGRRRRSYYPYFDSKDSIRVTARMSREGFMALIKDGLQFAFDLSPEGRALLWVDVKVFTFIHFESSKLEPGEPIYVFCVNSGSSHAGGATLSEVGSLALHLEDVFPCEVLSEGAFVAESSESGIFSVLPCVSFALEETTPVISKVGHKKVLVPHQWVYTTINTRELRELSIYDVWREIAIRPAPRRYQVMKGLIKLIARDTESLRIPFPDGQELVFSLTPIKFDREMRWLS